MASLRQLKDEGWSITLYCSGFCTHAWKPSWDQLIQYFGPDYELISRANWVRLLCEECGHRGPKVILSPNPDITTGMGGGGGPANHPGMSIEEATRRHHEFTAERKRIGLKTNEELAGEFHDRRKAKKKAERNGDDLIGPPNPWKCRKRGRWL